MSRFFAVLFAALLLTLPAAVAAEPAEDDMQSSEQTLSASAEETTDEEVKEMPPVVITATRVETPAREIASSMTVISEEEIQQKQKTTVLDLLRGTPGLDVVQSGGLGTQASVFLRGAKSEHTLVLIDGIEMNDPSNTSRLFDFSNLVTDNIERIEIIRGPQSTLYGSDAIGGVINIITKKGEGKPEFYLSGEYGSFYTFRESAGISGGNKLVNYSASISHLTTEGISAANEKDGNEEEDGYKNTSVSTRLGITPSENLGVDFFLRYSDATVDVDDFGPVDDPNNTNDSEQIFLKTQVTLSLFDHLWEQTLGGTFSKTDRELRDRPDPVDPLSSLFSYKGETIKFDWQHNLFLHETNTLTLGVETEEETLESSDSYGGSLDEDARITGYYVQDQIRLFDRFFTTLGVRFDDHDEFGSEVTYRITSAYLLEATDTKLKGTYGTGFKAPTLYQLFSPGFPGYPIGNPDLDPDKSEGWDVGIEQELCDGKVSLEAIYFENQFKDLIDFIDFVGYVNVGKAESKGVELAVSLRPCENLMVRTNYTYTDTEDKDTGEQLARRPKDKIGFDMNYQCSEKGNVNLGVNYVGKRLDRSGGEKLGGYAVVNLAAAYDINENLQFFGRIENLLDREYEEIKGFGTPGFSVFGGMKLIF